MKSQHKISRDANCCVSTLFLSQNALVRVLTYRVPTTLAVEFAPSAVAEGFYTTKSSAFENERFRKFFVVLRDTSRAVIGGLQNRQA